METEYHTSTTDTSRVIRAVAHRGAKALAQENSIEALTRAAEYGVPAIEIDVRLAADFGVPIIHDRTLERTYGHPGVVASMTTTELRELGVPQLNELLARFGGDHDIYIDLKEKCAILADAVGRVVAESGKSPPSVGDGIEPEAAQKGSEPRAGAANQLDYRDEVRNAEQRGGR